MLLDGKSVYSWSGVHGPPSPAGPTHLPIDPGIALWSAQFRDSAREREFRLDQYQHELRGRMALSAWSVVVIYAVFGVVDCLVVPDALELAWAIRYGLTVPLSLGLAVLSITRWAPRLATAIGVLHSLLGPLFFLIVGAVAESPGALLYSAWAVLFPLLVPQLTRLSVFASGAVATLSLALLLALEFAIADRPWAISMFLALLFLVGCSYGIWAAHASELASRRSWWLGKVIRWQMDELSAEREKSERLLLNVLPASIAARLRDGEGQTIADRFESVTVLFADIAGFTQYSARVSAEQLVERLDSIFSRFDSIADELSLEKIKTIGDAYMLAAGLPEPHDDPAGAVATMALAMRNALEEINREAGEHFSVRIGIHTGTVVAGVIGRRKFIYDIWGDTVNTASRMESHGERDRIQLSTATRRELDERFHVTRRGEIEVKGKGVMETWWLEGWSPQS